MQVKEGEKRVPKSAREKEQHRQRGEIEDELKKKFDPRKTMREGKATGGDEVKDRE